MNTVYPQLDHFLQSAKQEWQKMKPGLERIQAACVALGNPEKKFPSIHVAGTNGKGSVCAMLHSILTEAGYKVGLFTSPHLLKVNERFRIGNEEISDEELELILDVIARTLSKVEGDVAIPIVHPRDCHASLHSARNDTLFSHLTFFELCALIAFLYFTDQKVDIAILETGLGGRLDATNVVTPLVSVITEIGLDHTEILGPDIASIAKEKAGIIKEGVPVVCGASHPEARRVIEEVAKERGASISFVGAPPRGRPAAWAGTVTRPYDFKYKLNLKGAHQIHNAEIVLKVIELFNQGVGARHASPVQEESIQKGLQNVRWPGRMEWISKNPPILMDGAHNVDGVKALVEYCRGEACLARTHKWKILFSAASDKNVHEMLEGLQEIASEIILCKMENSRSIDPEKILPMLGAIHLHAGRRGELPLRISQNPIQSFHEIKKSLREGEGILITGSLYFIGEFKQQIFHERNPTNG